VFRLYVSDHYAWRMRDEVAQPPGQCLVKVSWLPDDPDNLQLFIMLKVDPGHASDCGWIYGVANPRTLQVTESGRLASCMRCHRQAQHDRIIEPANSGEESRPDRSQERLLSER
jgi:hypothetical protein